MVRTRFAAAAVGLLFLAACATTSPLATTPRDWSAIAGVWEEEWPGQQAKDRFRVEVVGETVTVVALTNVEKQKARNATFIAKRLSFYLDMDGGSVYYDLALVNDQLLAGRAAGGARNFDEQVRWTKVRESPAIGKP
jgi:hypothetical protein